jgi:hypothetical protein
LSNIGGVVTHCAHGSSHDGFDAEWREVIVLTFEAGRVNRSEVFDEADLDAALARVQRARSTLEGLRTGYFDKFRNLLRHSSLAA